MNSEYRGLRVAEGLRDQLLSATPQFLQQLESAKQTDPWRFGFGAIEKAGNILIGMGGFPTPPGPGIAEIAYGIAPSYQGRGFATELARALIQFACEDKSVTLLGAHTLPEAKHLHPCWRSAASKVGDAADPDSGIATWRWERPVGSTNSNANPKGLIRGHRPRYKLRGARAPRVQFSVPRRKHRGNKSSPWHDAIARCRGDRSPSKFPPPCPP